MSSKAAEITCNTNNTFGPGTANEHTVQWQFKRFCKGDKRLKDEEHSSWPSEVGNNKLRSINKADPLKTTREVTEELNVKHSMVVRPLKQTGKMKKLDKWVPHELTESYCFEVSYFLIPCNNNKTFLDWIRMCDKK